MAPGETTGQRKRNPRRRANKTGGKSDDKIATKRGEHNVKSPPPGKKGKKGETTFFAKGTKKTLAPTKGKGKKEPVKGKKDAPKGKKEAAKKPKPEKKKPVTAEDLEKEMDDYWLKSKDTAVVSKKLDDDMDSYWAKKGEAEATEAEEVKGEAAATEETKEATEESKE